MVRVRPSTLKLHLKKVYFLAAFEGKLLVVSGYVQVDAGKPLIIAVTLALLEPCPTEFFNQQWHWRESKWLQQWPHSKTLHHRVAQFGLFAGPMPSAQRKRPALHGP